MIKILNFFKRPEVKYILILFLVTRIILSIIGFSSRMMLESFKVNVHNFDYHPSKVLSIWGVWDSGYYLGIAEHGYSATLGQLAMTSNQANYAFFPLYPLTIKVLNILVNNYYLAGLIISNLCLLAAAWWLYKLIKLDYSKDVAKNSVKYLFLFPVAFILSGVFSESLFLLLLILAFYFARKEKWLAVGLSGLLLTLTRPLGILVLLPIAWEYFVSLQYKIKKINYQVLYLLFWPAGLIIFLFYIKYLSGNFLNYFKTQSFGWGHIFSNPLTVIAHGLTNQDIFQFLPLIISLALMLILILKLKILRPAYILLAALLFIFPLTTGDTSLNSLLRYTLPIFPIFIALATLFDNKKWEELLIIGLALLQGFLMVFWTIGLHLIV